MTWEILKPIVTKLISALLSAASPALREWIKEAINDLYKKAKETENPIDDMTVKFIAELLGVEVED